MRPEDNANAVAIVGMACRFPGAKNVHEFWENLRNGVESITFFSDEELSHVPREHLSQPNYVKARGILENIAEFDPAFFGLTPLEAGLMDPQHRLFLECAWHALEDAGYTAEEIGDATGVFAGADPSSHLAALERNPQLVETAGVYQLLIGNGTDHMAPRVSYLMNLQGPSIPVQTACSTSLVAIHLACQHLVRFECDTAIAGGSFVPLPMKAGYFYEEGGTLSPDGKCRAFDADAKGTALGSGTGVVVLKRLTQAMMDGDHIHAVILGSAVNNDGARKVGYTAPSVEGQLGVVSEALDMAEIDAAEVSYIETHGTGTLLGDPIEFEALRQVWEGGDEEDDYEEEDYQERLLDLNEMADRLASQETLQGLGNVPAHSGLKKELEASPNQPRCALGSVKTNIGHCNSAAGVAGLIKTVLCLKHRTLVPSLNFNRPNPNLDMENSPFYVNTETRPWTNENLYAGVSSFGIGGTNAHLILTEAPVPEPGMDAIREENLAVISAATPEALSQLKQDLHQHLSQNPLSGGALADWAFTLACGRKRLACRSSFSFRNYEEALAGLASRTPPILATKQSGPTHVIFMFPGQGKQYLDMGVDLFRTEPVFSERVDACSDFLMPLLGLNLADHLLAAPTNEAMRARLFQPDLWQPAIFVVEYALAELWISWGIQPSAMIGHSIGEYVAAVLSGVLELEDGLRLIAERGRLTALQPVGAMIAVVAPLAELESKIEAPISIAAVNGPNLCVISGPVDAVAQTSGRLKEEGLQVIKLESTHAFHSSMMEPLMEPLTRMASEFELGIPEIPYVSNLTGTWMSDEDAQDPNYWASHLRAAVRFNEGLELLGSELDGAVFLEVGPGNVLSKLAGRHPSIKGTALASLDSASKGKSVLGVLGDLWGHGVMPDWMTLFGIERQRLALPVYPFQRQEYWLAGDFSSAEPSAESKLEQKRDPDQWFYQPVWKQAPLSPTLSLKKQLEPGNYWMLLIDQKGEPLAQHLEALGQKVIRVRAGDDFDMINDHEFVLDPSDPQGYATLLNVLVSMDVIPAYILHCWRLDRSLTNLENLRNRLDRGYQSLALLAQNLGSTGSRDILQIGVVSNGMMQVMNEPINPEAASMKAAAWVFPKEFSTLNCRLIDLNQDDATPLPVQTIVEEMVFNPSENMVAIRGGRRWIETWEMVNINSLDASPDLVQGGQYLVINGFQKLGGSLMTHLVKNYKVDLIVADRAFFPPEAEWDSWLEEQGEQDMISRRIRMLKPILAMGTRVTVVSADPANLARMTQLKEASGPINGVFHLDRPTESGLVQAKAPTAQSTILEGKIREAMVTREVFGNTDFIQFFSENAAEGGIGKAEQAGIYYFLGALAGTSAGTEWMQTIDWGTRTWLEEGEDADKIVGAIEQQLAQKRKLFGMTVEEHITALEKIMTLGLPNVIVSTRDFASVMQQQHQFTAAYFQNAMHEGGSGHERPEMSEEYAAPTNEVEELVIQIWQEYFEINKVGINDNFFELGGHSLLAVQLLSKLNKTFGSGFTMETFFDAPTPAELTAIIMEQQLDSDQAAQLDEMLSEIEGLSEEELDALLKGR